MWKGILFLVIVMSIPSAAWALCDGVQDDTAAIQQAIHARQMPLPVGRCLVSAGLTVGTGERLSGQGVSTTYLLPITPGLTVVTANQAGAVIENLQIGYAGYPYTSMIGLAVQNTDRVLIRNVHISGTYGVAFVCQGAVSSLMEFVQIWNFQPNTMAGAWLGCTDWTMTQVEVHEQGASDVGGAAIWIWGGSNAIRFFGGNVSVKAGSGGQYVIGPGGQFYGTTLYEEP